MKIHIKDCNICLELKLVQHKVYSNSKFLLILTYQLKDLLHYLNKLFKDKYYALDNKFLSNINIS